jgi:uncharacterized membrane protein
MDSCPLPMKSILKIDRLICHETALLINGLWLKLFFFMFAVLFGLCIFGIVIFKKLNWYYFSLLHAQHVDQTLILFSEHWVKNEL